MPSYRYTDPVTGRFYPELRDAEGRNVGEARHGDEREFSHAPDQWWAPADPGSGEGGDGPGDSGGDAGDAPQDQEPQDGPVPAPPAVIPGS